MRTSLFAQIPHHDRRVLQIYTAGTNQYDLMVFGKAEYKHHHGHETASDWAGHYVLQTVGDGEVKFKLLQVILVSVYSSATNAPPLSHCKARSDALSCVGKDTFAHT